MPNTALRGQFRAHAKAVPVVLNGCVFSADPKEFSTGSLGWNLTGKMVIYVGGVAHKVQVGVNLTITGSKGAP